jgi:hypothetical protein
MSNFLQKIYNLFNRDKLYKKESQKDTMIGRCFGELSRELNLAEVEKILNENKNKTKSYNLEKRDVKEFSVHNLEKGRLKALVERKYIACLIKGDILVNKYVSTVNEEANEIERKNKEEKVSISMPFWIFKDEIVFSGAEAARDFVIPYLKELLGIEIIIPHYDIGRIYNDFKTKTGQVFGFGFIERPNSISAGSIFGEMEMDDPLVAELDESDKNFISINLKVKDKIIRASVYSIGSIVIMQKWNNMAETYPKLKIVRDALKAYEIKV